MDVNPIKPIPVVQPPRKVDRERHDRDSKKSKTPPDSAQPIEKEDDSNGIDTYA